MIFPVIFPVDSPPEQNSLAQNGPGRGGQIRLNRAKRETTLNQPIPVDDRCIRYAAWGIVLLALVHLCWLQLRPESELHQIYAVATESASNRAAKEHDQSDRIAKQVSDGNVLLKLAGYARTNPAVENSLGYFYFRTSYALYPRRLYAGPADQVINDGRDIMRIGFSPDPQWLREHDVCSVLIFGNDTPGGETPRLEILQSRNGQAGMQTNKSGGN